MLVETAHVNQLPIPAATPQARTVPPGDPAVCTENQIRQYWW
jgi:hypothetical protein